MQTQEFNIESKAPVYSYQRCPVNERSFLLYKNAQNQQGGVVGDYTVLDSDEDLSLSEKKVMNLISALNGRKNLLQLGEETKSRMLYHVVDSGENKEQAKVIFYHLGKKGVSKENAFLRIETLKKKEA
ncbi:MAG: hypothetical protein MRY79_09400 [Alphaproteobacteria bacterium]|nr:hypothetical protein [Alphaproteobacteria bacterium]